MAKQRQQADETRVVGTGHAEWVRVGDLAKHQASYQRELVESTIEKIVSNFDPDLLGTIEAERLANGDYRVTDGQNRVEAMMRLGMEDRQVLCNVRVGLTLKRAAEIFWRSTQQRKALTPFDLFNAKLVAQEPTAVALKRVLDSLDITPMSTFAHNATKAGAGNEGALYAIATCATLCERMGEGFLFETLSILNDAWREEQSCFDQTIVRGLSLFLAQHEHYVDRERLVRVLKKSRPDQVLHDARALKRASAWSLSAFTATVLNGLYNANLTRGRLADTPVGTYSNAFREHDRRHRRGAGVER